jgi:predicted  nucleic acid-binding Zn-ribbon protein
MSEPGPCIICGTTNYSLSMGGPTICPSCDCGDFGLSKVQRQAKEIERLTLEAHGHAMAAEELGKYLQAKDAEIERLRAADKVRVTVHEAEIRRLAIECGKAKAEIERLREQLHYANGTCDLAMKHRDEAEADNERLRAALKDIAGDDYLPDGIRAIEIARRALEPKP